MDINAPDAWQRAIKPNTKVFYAESISNPLLEVAPFGPLIEFARAHGLLTMVDNTVATPVNFRPASVGFDLILHSASKYLSGHTNVVAGVVAGRGEAVDQTRKLMNLSGVCLAPHSCH